MTDDNEEDGNQKAIKHVVKKSVSDVFGEEEKPPEPAYQPRYYSGTYNDWKQNNPGFAFQRAGETTKTSLTAAAWGKPRETAMREEYNEVGDPTAVHFTDDGWKQLRARIFRVTLKELDWERVVLMPDDLVLLEQWLDTVMRRGRFQAGREGSYYSHGTLRQVPITVGDNPPADPKALPASSIDLKDTGGWGTPDDDEVIDVNSGDDNE